MAISPVKDGGANVGAVFAFSTNATPGTASSGAAQIITAAGGDDGVKIIGETINRDTFGMPASALLQTACYYNLADTETLSLAVEIQESADGSSWDTAEVLQAATVFVTASGATTAGDVHTTRVGLTGRKQYVRFNCTPDLSASGTDTAVVTGTVAMFGAWDNALLGASDASDE